jgi:hypothetical protein
MRTHLKAEYEKTGDKSLLTTLKSSKTPPCEELRERHPSEPQPLSRPLKTPFIFHVCGCFMLHAQRQRMIAPATRCKVSARPPDSCASRCVSNNSYLNLLRQAVVCQSFEPSHNTASCVLGCARQG